MISKIENTMELVNQTFVLLVTYHLYMFTEFMTDMDARKIIGLSLMVTVLLNIVLSLGVVVVQNL